MGYVRHYLQHEPARTDVDAGSGDTLLEFGAPWCGHCIGAQAAIETVLSARENVAHFKIEDGRGKPLGRSFRIKLWPTLVLVRDGVEVARVVRPVATGDVAALFAAG